MPFGSDKPHSWLREDDDFDRYNKPGSSDWFDLSDVVSFNKPNNRHDALKVESLLGYGGYMDLEKSGGAMGLAQHRLEEPIKNFQEKNGLKVDGLLNPGGPTITKMKQLYGNVFGKTPAPTPAMADANAEVTHAGENGFLHDKGPTFDLKPNRRLDGKAHLMAYERWNRDWARGSGRDPKSLAPEYENYIRDIDEEHGHDPGLIFARDLVQQVGKYHGQANGAELAKALAVRLSDRPDLQRELLGGPVPTSPPIGTFNDGGEARIKTWIDNDRIANGIAPRYAPAQNDMPVSRTSSRAEPASKDAAQGEPDPANLLEYGPNFGLPEDWALAQQPPHEPDLPNPRPPRPGDGYPTEPDYRPEPSPPRHVPGFADEMPHPSEGVAPPRPPTKIDAQIADEYPVLSEDDPRIEKPILPEVVDLSKLDDDAFEEVAAKAGADRDRLEAAISTARERERHHAEAFARVVEETVGTFGDDVVRDGLVGAAKEYAKDVLAGKTPLDLSPEAIAKHMGRGALVGLGTDAAVFVGQLAWHAVGEASAKGHAEMSQDARGAHNEWNNELSRERRERGRIRPDN